MLEWNHVDGLSHRNNAMKFGLCTKIDELPLVEKAGFDYIEPTVATVLPDKPDQDFEPVARAVAASRIKAEAFNVFVPGTIKITGPAASLDTLRKYVSVVAPRVARLGGRVIVFGSGGARRVPDGFPMAKAMDQLAAFLDAIAPIAATAKITIAIEPLHKGECNIINLVKEGLELATRVNKPAVRALADLFHIGQEKEPYKNVAATGAMLAHVHIAHPISRMCPLPGDGCDYKLFFRAIKEAGYNGRISIESAWQDQWKQAPISLDYLRTEWEKAS